jgi:hypothetical protein
MVFITYEPNPGGSSDYPQAPDLGQLVAKFGGYHLITPEAWADHHEAMRQWHIARRRFTCCGRVVGYAQKSKRKRKRA